MNLIPDKISGSPHYWCTWMAQCSHFVRPGEMGGADRLNAELLDSWLTQFYPQVRGDLLALVDAGWDVPTGLDAQQVQPFYGAMVPDAKRFPSLTGTPTEKLAQLDRLIRDRGWRGTGLWLIAQGHGEAFGQPRLPDEQVEADWREKAQWSRAAGIKYWKVDFGMRGEDLVFRRMMTRVAHEAEPALLIEHVRNQGPINGAVTDTDCNPLTGVGRFKPATFQMYRGGTLFEYAAMLLHMTDVVRTYDVSWPLSTAITLDRVASLLEFGAKHPECIAILNCEDEPYMGAALGCAIGILRFPQPKPATPLLIDPHGVNQRMDEVTRAIRWSRIAPALPASAVPVTLSEQILVDQWRYEKGDVWEDAWIGNVLKQGAPAIIARNLPLPQVKAEGEPPFVVCSRHPNGAVAVATLPRSFGKERARHIPLADVTITGGDTIGVFGRYHSLTIQLPHSAGKVWAQDLAKDEAHDVTAEVTRAGTSVKVPGALIDRLCTGGDESDPGLVLQVSSTGKR